MGSSPTSEQESFSQKITGRRSRNHKGHEDRSGIGFPSRSLEGPSAERDISRRRPAPIVAQKSRLRSEIWPAYTLSRIFAYFATFCSNSLLLSSVRAHPITESPARSETGPYAGCSRQGDRPGFPASPHEPLRYPSRRPDGSNPALDCRGRRDRARCDRD
jgi:hypothetical protein